MEYKTYHYGDDKLNDIGWGCSYRNLQTILSCYKYYYDNNFDIPTIQELLKSYKKNINNINTKRDLWLEPYDIYRYLFSFKCFNGFNCLYTVNENDINNIMKTDKSIYKIKLNIYDDFNKLFKLIKYHFKNCKLPIIIDDGLYSYCFVLKNDNEIYLIDPHTHKDNNVFTKNINFIKKSFWMILIPFLKN
tara:strand:- start:5919 stop:6488 length:570 start_codon:yes stop_codon:yes gene_type:complete